MGYYKAGFDVTGVDMEPQKNYPFPFILANAFDIDLSSYDIIHASPHCQGYSTLSLLHGVQEEYCRDIEKFRTFLQQSGKPYIIENVVYARMDMHAPIMLCGSMFGLRTYRHRLFESSIAIDAPIHTKHRLKAAHPGKIPTDNEVYSVSGKFGQVQKTAREAMGITWMKTCQEIANALPPIYTEYLGLQLIDRM